MVMKAGSSLIFSYSSVERKQPCIWWVKKYFKDCLCNLSDEISFGFGFVSLICWGVAEIPQIITNFTNKSGHGVSLLFLLTWVVGDVFNLVGCLLEPATLPTQYYTALLYTISTVVLVLQCIYYDYMLIWWKCKKNREMINVKEVEEEYSKSLKPKPCPSSVVDSRIPIPRDLSKQSSRKVDIYYRSARSLASSYTPPFGSNSYLRIGRSGPPTCAVIEDSSSSDDEGHENETNSSSHTQPIRIPSSVVGYGTFLATAATLPPQSKALMQKYVGFSGRRLLNENSGMNNEALGVWLGWMMAAIYMGGRIPQICLNIKRGSVEGMNPLMFIFALVANVTYVGSILVRSTKWSKIKPNMPWLLDAIVCVGLDLFIILQYIYYEYMRKRKTIDGEDYGDYVEAEKSDKQ